MSARIHARLGGLVWIAHLVLGAAGATHAEAPAQIEEIVVTASRAPESAADTTTRLTTLSREDIEGSPQLAIDDLLRGLAAFSPFRRSSSLVAQPTTQGVSLRGIGPTAASRAVVLVDGVPLNDPFGGWVYWSRIPRGRMERVEVAEGGHSSVWGSRALGGVVQVLTRRPTATGASLAARGGTQGTADLDGAASWAAGPVVVEGGGGYFRTDGWEVIRADQRGAIDEAATSEHARADLRLDWSVADEVDVSVAGGWFDEERGNGTALTGNATQVYWTRAAADAPAGPGRLRLDTFFQDQTFESTFSAQAADRSSERPALDQFDVPASTAGGSLVWSADVVGHAVVVGSDVRWVDGQTNEDYRFIDDTFTRRRRAGGEEWLAGLFVRHAFEPHRRWRVAWGVRADLWAARSGSRREVDLATGEALRDERFDDREEIPIDPYVGVRFQAAEGVALRASAYRSFRAPTLNELYRPFRVRNDITEANPALEPEELVGGEVGVELARGEISARATAYWNELYDPIFNLTLAEGEGSVVDPCGFVPDGGSCRQRTNVGRARVRGLEVDLGWEPLAWLGLETRYALADTEVRRAPEGSGLVGKRLAQVPRHRVSLTARARHLRWGEAVLEGRYVSSQYEDDRNSRELDGYFLVDAAVRHEIAPACWLFVAAENVFDRTYEVAETGDGLVSVGAPLRVSAGLRMSFGDR